MSTTALVAMSALTLTALTAVTLALTLPHRAIHDGLVSIHIDKLGLVIRACLAFQIGDECAHVIFRTSQQVVVNLDDIFVFGLV